MYFFHVMLNYNQTWVLQCRYNGAVLLIFMRTKATYQGKTATEVKL